VAGEVADVMGSIAERATLYTTFAELQSELVRRLDVVVPADSSQRLSWSRDVFQPLTEYTLSELLSANLDLRVRQNLSQPLTPAQQTRLRTHFENLSRVFRAASKGR